QNCSGCGTTVLKVLAQRIHSCPKCGLQLDRDHNAALNILTCGLREIACGELASGLGIRSSKRQLHEAGSSGL
ncbi:MAG: transposase, partial [Methanotrichaceae archaeon]|nr:transposase [Methanotrichaceae archaeon]